MWVMLIKDLPTNPMPPRMSIFWSVPWSHEEWAVSPTSRRVEQHPDGSMWDERWFCTTYLSGREPNWAGARKIVYQGQDIRVFPHEYTEIGPERMAEFVGGSHYLVPEGVAEQRLAGEVMDGRLRPIYEQALLAGCEHDQAVLVACGHDITIPDVEYPPLGWYRLRDEYAVALGLDWERSDKHGVRQV